MLANIERLLVKYGMNFVNGLGTTLLLAFISVLIGCVIGAFVAIMRLSKNKLLNDCLIEAATGPDMAHIPYPVTPDMVFDAMTRVENM